MKWVVLHSSTQRSSCGFAREHTIDHHETRSPRDILKAYSNDSSSLYRPSSPARLPVASSQSHPCLSIEQGRPAPFRGRDERRVLVWGRGRVKPLPRPKRLTMTCAESTLVRVSRGVKDSASTAGLAGRN